MIGFDRYIGFKQVELDVQETLSFTRYFAIMLVQERPKQIDCMGNYDFSTTQKTMEAIQAECQRQGIGSKNQVAYVLATVEHETAQTFKPVREAFWLSENWRRQNLRYYPFYGRGFVQITWQANYQKFSDLLGIDLVGQPDEVMDNKVALWILVYGFKTGTFTGRKITDFINNAQTDFINARKCINGKDKAQKIANLAEAYLKQLPLNSVGSQQNMAIRKGNFSVRLSPGIDKVAIKYSPELQASEITDSNLKFTLDREERLEIKWFSEVANHYVFELETPVQGRFNWYAFDQHVEIFDDDEDHVIEDIIAGNSDVNSPNLKVPFFSQRDNKTRPSQTCNMTCSAMVIEYFFPGTNGRTPGQLEDAMTKYCTSNWGHEAIYYHDKIVKTLANWNVKSVFSITTPFSRIKEHLASGNPVIYSGKFTRSGHIIVLRGYDNTGFWVNDPWGEWFSTGYQDKSGENLHYSYRMISNLSNSGSGAGWAHLCTKM